MEKDWRTYRTGTLWAGFVLVVGLICLAMAIGLICVAIAEAKDCTLQAWDCAPGDRLVESGMLHYDIYVYSEEQALELADGVWIDCNYHWAVGNGTPRSAGYRLGHGSGLYNCFVYGFEFDVKFNGWQAWAIGGETYGSTQEGLHFTAGTVGNYVCCMTIRAPQEGLYFHRTYNNVVEYVTVDARNATYANDGASDNQVRHSSLYGGPNRSVFSAAGPGNIWHNNEYYGGTIVSADGGQPYTWIGPWPVNATIRNDDGALALY